LKIFAAKYSIAQDQVASALPLVLLSGLSRLHSTHSNSPRAMSLTVTLKAGH
jgi:hypothetical protein